MMDSRWSLSEHRVDPGTARCGIIWQHERIRALLDRARSIAEAASEGAIPSPKALATAIADIRSAMEAHFAYEETHWLPVLRADSSGGGERADEMLLEHEGQRDLAARLYNEVHARPGSPGPVSGLRFLAEWLLSQMAAEERTLAPLLHRSPVMTTLNRATIGFVGLVFLLASACADQNARNQPPQRAQLTQAIATPPRDPPERLSRLAMATLKAHMASHARDMDRFVSAIMILDYSDIAARAKEIAEKANRSRPIYSDASELTSSLPPRFFVRQDDLKAAARALSAAANELNPYLVAEAYGKVSETCVRCHADYRPRNGS